MVSCCSQGATASGTACDRSSAKPRLDAPAGISRVLGDSAQQVKIAKGANGVTGATGGFLAG